MGTVAAGPVRVSPVTSFFSFNSSLSSSNSHFFHFLRCPIRLRSLFRSNLHSVLAKKQNPLFEPVSKELIVEESAEKEETDGFEDGASMEGGDYFEDSFEEETELCVGDGRGGGGIVLCGTWWEKEALAIAEDVVISFGDLKLYAFKTSANSTIQVRIEKLSNKYGSPSMSDIEAFSSTYRARLDEAEHVGAVPDNISIEVSSPGIERIVRIPHELDRFKDLPMYVKYVNGECTTGAPRVRDGVFKLDSVDLESSSCTWSLANVKVNRESMGKGRPLSKKQREWRLQIHFNSLQMVRLYSDL